ncbi:hypothetical protein [Acinetobacter pittii]|uniref:hypothetical protein n=1 Tax=Acinetobacter pittii TaxID=48296 RepID=UPI001BDF3363|nr:hypothetical protein [Acinetobacter pittii]MBT1522588.1 hypothetical protein [Acinetobacter pittii]MDQ9887702.1 hypothetical protein [Acinetobacter pittii]
MEVFLKILEVIAGISVFGSILKWIFSPNYRLSLRKKDFKEFSAETNNLISFCEAHELDPTSKSHIQLQNAFNEFLGSSKYHYSIFLYNFREIWNFRSKFWDLGYAGFLIIQKVVDNKAELHYRLRIETIKNIEKISIYIITVGSFLYVLLIFFEFFFLKTYLTKGYFDQASYDKIKLYSLSIFVICYVCAAIFGSKSGTALSLKDTFNIKDKIL